MLVIFFLILFTKVLADSDEDKYVDLLPDEEKQEFLDKVARRILKDVESKEILTGAKSGEVADEHLEKHTEYVKSILKDEKENLEKSEGEENDKGSKSASEEKEVLGVQPLETEKTSLQKEKASDESASNNIPSEVVTNDAPKIKRSVEDGKVSKSVENEEKEKSNEKEAENENVGNDNDIPNAKDSSEKGSEATESKTPENEEIKVASVESNQSDDTRNISVKGIHESRRTNDEDEKQAENTTKIETTTPAVEATTFTESVSHDYSNVSNAEGEYTTTTYPSESSSVKSNTKNATVDDILLESTIEVQTTEKSNDSESLTTKNDTTKVSEDDVETKNTRTSTLINNVTTEPTLETTGPATEATVPVTEATKIVPETTEIVTETTDIVTETTKIVPETTTGSETTIGSESVASEAVTEFTTVLVTTESTPVSISTTEEDTIIVEDFTSTTTAKTSVSSTTKTNKKAKKKQKTTLPDNKESEETSEEVTTVAVESDEESVEATTKKAPRHKVIVHKPIKVIVGPKAKKMAEAGKDAQNKNFIDLEKAYFDNNYKVKVGKAYQVYEIPADQSPFIQLDSPVIREEPVIVPNDEEPYYVPTYNYSPDNAYYNPQNRLGPNAADSSENNAFDEDLNIDKTEAFNFKTNYGSKRKKFGTKQSAIHSIHKKPVQGNEPLKGPSKFDSEDYLDSDYYFGRVRKVMTRNSDLSKFPNSDENDHPAHSIREGSLKDHVRAVRNILFQQKSFGLLERDKYGTSVEKALRKGRKRNEDKQALRKTNDDYRTNKINDEDRGNNYFGRSGAVKNHIQKVGYLTKQNATKDLYVMDDFFKANVEKYIEERGISPSTPLPNVDNEVISFLRKERSGNDEVKRDSSDLNARSDHNARNVEENLTDNIKLNLRRNEVVKVSYYLQVLKDMVTMDNKALVQYDWLGTTVDIQAALQKLFELTSLVANEEDVHPADLEILKYVLFLNKLASEILEANNFGAQLREKFALPRNKKKKLKPRILTEKGLINRVWLYLRKEVPQVTENGALKQLNSFLIGVEDGLYDLHDAIKNVAKITKYKNQHWFQNLKDLYISTDEKQLLELLLHMTAVRLFALIEESAKNGLEDDYIKYMKYNKKQSKKTLDEMMFIMEILNEYKKFVE